MLPRRCSITRDSCVQPSGFSREQNETLARLNPWVRERGTVAIRGTKGKDTEAEKQQILERLKGMRELSKAKRKHTAVLKKKYADALNAAKSVNHGVGRERKAGRLRVPRPTQDSLPIVAGRERPQ